MHRLSFAAFVLLSSLAAAQSPPTSASDQRYEARRAQVQEEFSRLRRQADEASSRRAYAEAFTFALQAVELAERSGGIISLDDMTVARDLAGSLAWQLNRYAEAETLFATNYQWRTRRNQFSNDIFTPGLDATSRLANFYIDQRRYAEAAYILQDAVGRARGGERPPDDYREAVYWAKITLAAAYRQMGRIAEAEQILLRLVEEDGSRDGSRARSALAELYVFSGRSAEAEPLALRDLAWLEQGERDHILVANADPTMRAVALVAAVYAQQGRYAEAESLLRRVLTVVDERDADSAFALRTAIAMGDLFRRQGRPSDAEPYYRRAFETWSRLAGPDHPNSIASGLALSQVLRDLGRFGDAERLLLRGRPAADRGSSPQSDPLQTIIFGLGRLYQAQERYAEAEPLLARALEARQHLLGNDIHTEEAASALAATRLEIPALAARAVDPARLAVTSLRRRLASGSGVYADAQRDRDQPAARTTFLALADALWNTRQTSGAARQDAFAALQESMGGTTSRAVIQAAVERFADSRGGQIGALVRERERISGQWRANNDNIAAALAVPAADAPMSRADLSTELNALQARIDAIDGQLRRDFPEYFDLVHPAPVEIAALQLELAPNEAILMVVPSPRGAHLIAIGKTEFRWERSQWTESQIDDAVAQLLGDIRTTMSGGRFSYNRRTAHELHGQIIAPVASALAGTRHLFIVAAGSLSSLPFGILVTDEPQGSNEDPDALRATHWFADAHALIQLPSIQSLQFLRRYRENSAGRDAGGAASFVGFGNPILRGPANPGLCNRGGPAATTTSVASSRLTRSGGVLADISLLQTLCPLPATAAELERMRLAFRAPAESIYIRDRASEQVLRSMNLLPTRILAFATHGLVAGEVSGSSEPGLVLTPPASASEQNDGFLAASEVTALRLNADWVILSACNTAAGDGSSGAPGLSGLARAFFYAGARNLLASYWPVEDEASSRLTVRTIELMRDHPDYSRAEALSAAMREVRNDAGHSAWAHPGVWAPFGLIGDWAR